MVLPNCESYSHMSSTESSPRERHFSPIPPHKGSQMATNAGGGSRNTSNIRHWMLLLCMYRCKLLQVKNLYLLELIKLSRNLQEKELSTNSFMAGQPTNSSLFLSLPSRPTTSTSRMQQTSNSQLATTVPKSTSGYPIILDPTCENSESKTALHSA